MTKINAQREFKVFEKKELERMSEQLNGQLIDQIDYNLAYVERFEKTGDLAIFPPKGKYAILFYSEESFQEMVESRSYPVPLETDSFYEKDKDLIKDLKTGLPILMQEFFERLGIEPLDLSLAKQEHLIYLTDIINKRYKEDKLEYRDTYLLGYFLGNYMINFIGDELEWYLEVQSTLNVHWVPLLKKKNHHWKFNFWKTIDDDLEGLGEVDLLKSMREEVAFYRGMGLVDGIPTLSPQHADFLKNGKVGN